MLSSSTGGRGLKLLRAYKARLRCSACVNPVGINPPVGAI